METKECVELKCFRCACRSIKMKSRRKKTFGFVIIPQHNKNKIVPTLHQPWRWSDGWMDGWTGPLRRRRGGESRKIYSKSSFWLWGAPSQIYLLLLLLFVLLFLGRGSCSQQPRWWLPCKDITYCRLDSIRSLILVDKHDDGQATIFLILQQLCRCRTVAVVSQTRPGQASHSPSLPFPQKHSLVGGYG